jgi:hypothetical protein
MYRASDPAARSQHAPLVVLAGADQILALRMADGLVAWRHDLARPQGFFEVGIREASEIGPFALEIHDHRVYIARSSQFLCLDYLTGAVVGSVQLPETASRPQMLIDGARVLVVTGREVYAFDLGGQLLWRAAHGIQHRDGRELWGSASIAVPGNARQGDFAGWK